MNDAAVTNDVRGLNRRPALIFALSLFSASWLVLVPASLFDAEKWPRWVGFADAGSAFVLVCMGVWVGRSARHKITDEAKLASYHFYRAAANLPLFLLIIFFTLGERIRWFVLLPGLAWRVWLLVYVLPAALTLWRGVGIPPRKKEPSPVATSW